MYYIMEGLWRIPSNGGWAHISMALVGGGVFALIGALNQIPNFYERSMLTQAVISTILILLIEFIAGLILNIWLGLHIWDYSHLPMNLFGQICLPMALVWLLLMPFAIWMEDRTGLLYYLYVKAMGNSQVDLYKNKQITAKFHSQTINQDVYVYSLYDAYREFFVWWKYNN